MEELNISDLLKYFWSFIWIVAITTVLGFLASWIYTSYIQVPLYQSQTSLVLTTTDESMITQNDVNLNKNLIPTYREIIKRRRVLSEVIDNLGLDISVSNLASRIDVTSANDTELIVISVLDEDSTLARDIANEIAVVFKEEITSIYNIKNVSIVDDAIEATAPSNVNAKKQYLIGIIGGFLIGSIIIFILFYFDDTIHSAEDIEKKIGMSVLATVPKYNGKRK